MHIKKRTKITLLLTILISILSLVVFYGVSGNKFHSKDEYYTELYAWVRTQSIVRNYKIALILDKIKEIGNLNIEDKDFDIQNFEPKSVNGGFGLTDDRLGKVQFICKDSKVKVIFGKNVPDFIVSSLEIEDASKNEGVFKSKTAE